PGNQGRPRTRPEPDWPRIHADLRLHKVMPILCCGYEGNQAPGCGAGIGGMVIETLRWRFGSF
ncbi:MAG: hypothetical protein OWU33_16410, partial [Firmicutes bacterium]|nr:hypothetical protein [Bacillota bacterium]